MSLHLPVIPRPMTDRLASLFESAVGMLPVSEAGRYLFTGRHDESRLQRMDRPSTG